MQPKDNNFVMSGSQVMSLITSTIIGVGVLTLPRTVTETAHQSGWISVIIGGCLGAAILWLILKLGKRFEGLGLINISEEVLGAKNHKRLGRILTFPFILLFLLYWMSTTAGVARTFGEVVVTAVLIRTPLEVIVGSMLLVAFVLVLYDLEVVARVNEVLLPIIIIPVLFIAILSFQSADFIRLLPIFAVDWKTLLQSGFFASFAYLGYELIALFSGNMKLNRETTRAAMLGIGVPILVYALIAVAGISAFGYEELQQLMWPTLELVKTTEMPGLILERLESAFLGVWVAAVFTTSANLFFSICFATKKVLNLKTHRYIAVILLPLLYFLAMWPQNVHQLFQYLQYAAYAGLGLSFFGPLLIILMAMIRKKSVGSSSRRSAS